jgi:hypothetical protein
MKYRCEGLRVEETGAEGRRKETPGMNPGAFQSGNIF